MKTHQKSIVLLDTKQINYLREMHYFLNKIYYSMMFGTDEATIEKLNIDELKHSETMWMSFEKNACNKKYDCYQYIENPQVVENALQNHLVHQHKLFNYLQNEADIHDLKTFILHESILNLEFFDYLALSIVGVSDQAKSEIIANLWDEAGHGQVQQFHTNLFRKLMRDLGLQYDRNKIISNMSWEALAGMNLFSYFSIYPQHKMKYFGLLAATEMLDPPHYQQLIIGMKRIVKTSKFDYTYYSEHASIDIHHAAGWLNKVILPELQKYPEKTHEFWLGFYLRLDSTERYYNYLFNLFSAKLAA